MEPEAEFQGGILRKKKNHQMLVMFSQDKTFQGHLWYGGFMCR